MFPKVQHVSASPTNPQARTPAREFDVADLYRGPAATGTEAAEAPALDEKLRQAYFWIVNHAVISPFYDIEYNDPAQPPQVYPLGDTQSPVTLPSGQSYSSFVLLPLLTLAARRKCLFVGGPGRGKTTSAVLMGVLAGYPLREVQRAIQKGQPQLTVADLIGTPLPADLVQARQIDQIGIAWRKWLGMRVKIIDEYNRIPTRTQSALLTLMSDNYAELYDQVYECPPAAWYLTANDDAGGGTYQVIEALRDRIDIVVKALHFNSRFLGELLDRIEHGVRPEAVVPPEIVFTPEECDRLHDAVVGVRLPRVMLRRLSFFASQFEFCDVAAAHLEYKTKDTARLAGIEWHQLTAMDTGKDRLADLGSQTRNGLSVRALLTALVYVKAMAYFRGADEVGLEDVRQMLPFVLHDKLLADPDAPFFETARNGSLRIDKVAWIRQLFDRSCGEYERLDLDRDDPVGALVEEFERGLEGLDEKAIRARLVRIEGLLARWSAGRKFPSHLYDDVLTLKYLHQRYTNYLRWLRWRG